MQLALAARLPARLPQAPFRACSQHQRALQAVRCSSSAGGEAGGSGGAEQSSELGQSSDASAVNLGKGFARQPQQQQQQQEQQQRTSAADALQNTLAGLSANVGRVSDQRNVILDTTNDEEKWRELDLQVNEYPGQRTFKAIGTGDQDFVASMRAAVEAVVGTVHEECVQQRLSAKGNYISVTVTCNVESPEQVLEIYSNMKKDGRLRFFF